MLNSVSSVLIGIYIIAAIARGNGDRLLQQLSNDARPEAGMPGLLQWMVAILILNFLASNSNTKSIGQPLLFAAYFGIGFQFVNRNGIGEARERVSQFWDFLGFSPR